MNLFGDAIADYDKTISLVPQHFVAHYNRGLLLALVGSNNKAIDDFSFVINKEPDNVMAIYNRALLRKETGDYRGAAADFTKSYGSFPISPMATMPVPNAAGNTETCAVRSTMKVLWHAPT